MYLQELMTIDCELQTNLQSLALAKSRPALESQSTDIKHSIRQFKEKLKEAKDFCDSLNSHNLNAEPSFLGSTTDVLVTKLTGGRLNMLATATSNSSKKPDEKNSSAGGAFLSSSPSSSSSLSQSQSHSGSELYVNELQIQREHLTQVESRFRNTYLSAQVTIDQSERTKLFEDQPEEKEMTNNNSISNEVRRRKVVENKKTSVNNQVLLAKSNEMSSRLSEISKQLKWTEQQTNDIIPVLDTSSRSLRNTQQEFGYMRTVITDGKRLLIRLSRREFTDKLLTVVCLCFFFTVVFYIVWKRLF